MRTNIEIDGALMEEALRLSGLKTKRAAVEEALRLLVQRRKELEVLKLYGKVPWEGNLDESRLGHEHEER